jgi:hypothetical protein
MPGHRAPSVSLSVRRGRKNPEKKNLRGEKVRE